ncbi:MAG: aminotransferase class V-fold PLP-dependent enzyme [Actinobacteria bacterium]|nr:aminotransferase class V-fold PLP-dependent enzyme [Actinomycetota bacterium]MCG2798393.1 aminotransferase class V-fold PLP-dependent enzyme [Cellulomonas sp.]
MTATAAPLDVRHLFTAPPGYLNAATSGLAPRAVAQAMHTAVDAWAGGEGTMAGYDLAIERARTAFARLVGVPAGAVSIGSQVSVMVGAVAASLPDGARVLLAEGDFTSVTYPFLAQAHRGIQVRTAPPAQLAEAVRSGDDLVAFSLVQSADGMLLDGPAIAAAARSAGVRTLVDLTQAAGWLPVAAGAYDVTVTGAYKWLCAPRGTAFATVGPQALEWLRPVHAGWYAGADPATSMYGCAMHLADDARRLDVSPAWLAWCGAAPALELFAELDPQALLDHDVRLADTVRTELGLDPTGSAIVALPDPDGSRRRALTAAGCTVAGRDGGVRLAFHVWNDEEDVARAVTALRA